MPAQRTKMSRGKSYLSLRVVRRACAPKPFPLLAIVCASWMDSS